MKENMPPSRPNKMFDNKTQIWVHEIKEFVDRNINKANWSKPSIELIRRKAEAVRSREDIL